MTSRDNEEGEEGEGEEGEEADDDEAEREVNALMGLRTREEGLTLEVGCWSTGCAVGNWTKEVRKWSSPDKEVRTEGEGEWEGCKTREKLADTHEMMKVNTHRRRQHV